jgi:serine/threonine protein kinase
MVYQIGEFSLMERLGEGAHSKVRKAIHIPTQELYAVKIIQREKLVATEQSHLIHREIQVMLQMNHPGLITLHTVLETPDRWYMVLEYASGGELLSSLQKNGPFDEETARDYFHQLVDAIDYMHRKRALHRDLKPENLLFDDQSRLKVADFGLSIIANSGVGLLRTKCGTPYYAAPELFNAEEYAGPPVDIWSMGVVLYAMLSGTLPFMADTVEELAAKIKCANVRYPSGIPRGAIDLMRKIFVTKPAERYTMHQIREHSWFVKNYRPTIVEEARSVISRKIEFVGMDTRKKLDQWQKMKEIGNDNFPTAFEVIARLLYSADIAAFSSNKSRRDVLDLLERMFDLYSASLIEVRDVHSIIASCRMKSETIVARFDVLPMDVSSVIVIGCRIQGSQRSFQSFFTSVKQFMC